MWPFKKKRPRITARQFAVALDELSYRCASDFLPQFREQAGNELRPADDSLSVLREELLIAHLWCMSRVLEGEKPTLDLLHETYFAARPASAKPHLVARYESYYDAWRPEDGGTLGAVMASHLLGRQGPVLDAMLTFPVQSHAQNFMLSVLELRGSYGAIDA